MIVHRIRFAGQLVPLEITGPDTIEIDEHAATPALVGYLREHKAAIIHEACMREWKAWKAQGLGLPERPVT